MKLFKRSVAILLALFALNVNADSTARVLCTSLFNEALAPIEVDFRQSVIGLAAKIEEFNSLPSHPETYTTYEEQQRHPRNRWFLDNKPSVSLGFYDKLYKLEKEAKSKGDPQRNEEINLELAKMYVATNNIHGALLSTMKACRYDLTLWAAETLKSEYPHSSFYYNPNGLNNYVKHLSGIKERINDDIDHLFIGAKEGHWAELELEAQRLVENAKPDEQAAGRKIYQQLGENYLEHKMYQEAIWSFRLAGNMNKADQLHQWLLKILLNSPMTLTDVELGGVTKSKVYELAPGVRVIGKVKSSFINGSQKPADEYLAYKISELLGMNSVSTTVMRNINGRRMSLQVMVQRREIYNELLRGSDEIINRNHTTMDVFDYLVVNQDRSNHMGAHNQLYRFGNKQVLIDHGIIFRPYFIIRHLPFLKNLNINKDVINDEYAKLENGLPHPEFIQALEDLDRPEQQKKLRALFAGGYFSLRYHVFEHRRKTVLKEIKRLRN